MIDKCIRAPLFGYCLVVCACDSQATLAILNDTPHPLTVSLTPYGTMLPVGNPSCLLDELTGREMLASAEPTWPWSVPDWRVLEAAEVEIDSTDNCTSVVTVPAGMMLRTWVPEAMAHSPVEWRLAGVQEILLESRSSRVLLDKSTVAANLTEGSFGLSLLRASRVLER